MSTGRVKAEVDRICATVPVATVDQVKSVIDKAVAAEREACAAVAAGYHDHSECSYGEGYMDGRHDAAAAIRAR